MVEGGSRLHVNESDPKLVDLQSVAAEMQRLREENIRLRYLLQEHRIQIPAVQSTTGIPVTTNALPSAHIPVLKAEQRIALFRSLFHGRDDVYAVRWENVGHPQTFGEREEKGQLPNRTSAVKLSSLHDHSTSWDNPRYREANAKTKTG